MELIDKIIKAYPQLATNDFAEFRPDRGSIVLQDDGDGIAYIAKWNYEQPIPEGLTLGKSLD